MIKLLVSASLLLLASSISAEEPSGRTVTETFTDWQLVCVEQGKVKRCEVKQTLVNQDNNVVAVITVAKKPDNELLLQLTLPHLLDLTKAVAVSVDGATPRTYPFRFCNKAACFVLAEDKKLFAAFKKGSAGVLAVKPIGTAETMNLNYSLKGFSAALKSLKDS